jgi:hypothetical protein
MIPLSQNAIIFFAKRQIFTNQSLEHHSSRTVVWETEEEACTKTRAVAHQ